MDPMGYGIMMGLTLLPCLKILKDSWSSTLLETNSKLAPEKGWLEDEKSFWDTIFSGENC